MSVKHGFVSAAADGGDATKLRPSNWGSTSTDYVNAPTHTFDGGSLGALLYRDTGAIDGASWLADVAVGSVLVSGGVGAAPAWSASPTILGTNITGIPETAIAAGSPTFTRVLVGDGDTTNPAIAFDDGAGFYQDGSNKVSIASATVRIAQFSASGLGLFANNLSLSVGAAGDTVLGYAASAVWAVTNAFQFPERADPAAPASNNAVLYARDNGSGKTELVVRFPTGAIQIIKTEP